VNWRRRSRPPVDRPVPDPDRTPTVTAANPGPTDVDTPPESEGGASDLGPVDDVPVPSLPREDPPVVVSPTPHPRDLDLPDGVLPGSSVPGSMEAVGGGRVPPADDVGPEDASVAGAHDPEPVSRPDVTSAVVLAITNQKGGVGKTTTTVSLGAALAGMGLDVLVIDLDPQGNATTGLGLRVSSGSPSTYRVIVEKMPMIDAVEPTAVRHLHIVPSSLDLAGAEIELVPQFSRERRLAEAVDSVRDQYDVVLIDCPPSLGLLTVNAMVAADQVLVPIQCEYYALEGLSQLMQTIEMVTSGLNARLRLGGVLMTMYDARTNLSQQVVDEVRGHFGDVAFSTVIPRTVRLSEAPSFGQPITEFDPTSRGARSYQRLAGEVARRLGYSVGPSKVSALDALLGEVVPSQDDGAARTAPNSDDASSLPESPSEPLGDTGMADDPQAPVVDDSDASGEHSGGAGSSPAPSFHVKPPEPDPSPGPAAPSPVQPPAQEGQTWQT
jgi:chromosome partitioning protein